MSIEVRGLCKRFGSYTAVHDLNFDIADGEFFVLLGPSGCGKTTTLRMIAGLDVPSEGMVRIRGRDVTYAEPRHRDIAMVFQDYGLYPNMTVYKNIEFPLKVREGRRAGTPPQDPGHGRAPGHQRAAGPQARQDQRRPAPAGLTARALVRNPHVFLMDEPLSISMPSCARPCAPRSSNWCRNWGSPRSM